MVSNTLRHKPIANPRDFRGFTLIELLVVTAIIVVVSSIVLVNNNRFGGVIQLENLAYDVALSIRQAQVYGTSVQRYGAGDFSKGYGMHFSENDPQHYELFADVNADGFFTSDENVVPSPYTISSGFKVSALCVPEGTDAASCTRVSTLDIVFKRPETDAYIRKNGEAALNGSTRIVLMSPRGDVMSVLVGSNGQISVRREATQ